MVIGQLFDRESSAFTYLLIDELTRQAALIDPVREQLERDVSLVRELRVRARRRPLARHTGSHARQPQLSRSGARLPRSYRELDRGGATVQSAHLGKSPEEFAAIMRGLNLPPPRMLHAAVPANLGCGRDAAP